MLNSNEKLPSVIALDVVLRPDVQGEDLAIRLSESLPADRPFTLNRIDRLPHVSLFMAHVRSVDVPAMAERLTAIAVSTAPISVEVDLETYESPDRPTLGGLRLERTAEVQQLHETIVSSLRDFGWHESSDAAYVLDPSEPHVRPLSIQWTVEYLTKASFDQFHPHITLGLGLPTDRSIELPTNARFDRLALCQLGNWNTCRKILAEWTLTESG